MVEEDVQEESEVVLPIYLRYLEVESSEAEEISDYEFEMVDEYGEEAGQHEFSKIKKEKVFGTIDFSRRKTKIVCTLG